MDCPGALRELAVMNHDLKRLMYRINKFENSGGNVYERMFEKRMLANEINTMMTKHRARINELQILTGCQTDYMKVYNTGISVCEFH